MRSRSGRQSSWLELVKAVLKRNKLTYRASVLVYVYGKAFLADLGATSVAILQSILGLRLASRLLSIPTLQAALHVRVSRLYSKGDAYFHEGNWRRALRKWVRSLHLQQKGALQLSTSPERDHVDLTYVYWTVAIGHIALLDSMVKLAELGLLPSSQLRLFINREGVANSAYLKLFSEFIQIRDYPLDRDQQLRLRLREQRLNIIMTTLGPRFLYDACAMADIAWSAANRPPLLRLPAEFCEIAERSLLQLGWKRDHWFATLHVRGPRHRKDRPDITRNATLDNYTKAVDAVGQAGGQVVLLGEAGVKIPQALASRLVNYANSNRRNDVTDIFLCGACRFFIGTSSGVSHVPGTFGVPVLFTNVSPPFSRPWRPGDLWAPKLLWNDAESRYLTLLEMMTPPTNLLDTAARQRSHGLACVDNDEDDLALAVEDMLAEVLGRESPEHVQRAQRWVQNALRDIHHGEVPYGSRLSPRFAIHRARELGIA